MQLNGAGIYQEQNVDIEGTLDIEGEIPAEQILQFAMQAKGLGVDLQSSGSVNPSNLDGTKISLKANSKDLTKLEEFLETTFPAVTPIDVSLDFLSTQGSYELSKIDLQLGENHLTGDVLLNSKDSFVRANLSSEKIDLGPFIATESTQGKENEIKDKSMANDETEIDWSWMKKINSEINLEVGEILVNQQKLKETSAQLKLADGVFDINSLKAKLEFEDEEIPERSFVTDMIEISGTLQPLAEKTLGEDIQLNLKIKDASASLALQGDANVNGIKGNNLQVEVDAKKLDAVSKYLQTDLSPHLPAKINANIETSEQRLHLQQLIANFKESDITGDIEADWSGEIMKINGKVDSKLLDLTPLMSKSEDVKAKPVKENKKAKDEKIFSDEAIDWGWLETFDVDVNLNINKLVANKNIFHKVKTKVDLGEGALNIKPFAGIFCRWEY